MTAGIHRPRGANVPIPNLAELGTIKLKPTNSIKLPTPKETTGQTEEPPWAQKPSALRKRPPPLIPTTGEERTPIPKSRSPVPKPRDVAAETPRFKYNQGTPNPLPSRSRPPPAVPHVTSFDKVANDTTVVKYRGSGSASPPLRQRNLPPTPKHPSAHDEQNGGVQPSVLTNRRLPPIPSGDTNPKGLQSTGKMSPSIHPIVQARPNLPPKPRVPIKPKLPPR